MLDLTALERVERRLEAIACREYDEALRAIGRLDGDVGELAGAVRRLRRLQLEAMEAERAGRLTP